MVYEGAFKKKYHKINVRIVSVCVYISCECIWYSEIIATVVKTAMICKTWRNTSEYSRSIIKNNRLSCLGRSVLCFSDDLSLSIFCLVCTHCVCVRLLILPSNGYKTFASNTHNSIGWCDVCASTVWNKLSYVKSHVADYTFFSRNFFYSIILRVTWYLRRWWCGLLLNTLKVWPNVWLSFVLSSPSLFIYFNVLFIYIFRQGPESSVRLRWHDMFGQSRSRISTNNNNATVANEWSCLWLFAIMHWTWNSVHWTNVQVSKPQTIRQEKRTNST